MDVTLNLQSFQFNKDNRAAKQYKVTFKLQLSGQTAEFVQDSSKMNAYTSGGYTRNLQDADKSYAVLLYIAFNMSNPITSL